MRRKGLERHNGFLKAAFRKQALPVTLLVIGYTAVSASAVAFALLSKGVVDRAVGGLKEGFFFFAVLMAAAGLGQVILNAVCHLIEERVKARLENDIRNTVYTSFLHKEYRAASAFHSAEVINRLSADTAVVSDAVVGLFPNFVQFTVKILLTFIVLAGLDLKFTLIITAGGLVAFFFFRLFKLKIKQFHREVQQAEGRVRAGWQEELVNFEAVKAFSAENTVSKKSFSRLAASFAAKMKRRNLSVLSSGGLELVFRAGNCFAVVWGAVMLMNGAVGFTFGTLTAVLQLVSQIQQPFLALTNLIPKYYQMSASAERLSELTALPDELPENGQHPSPDAFASLSFDSVVFSYNESKRVFDGISFCVKRGETVAVTGGSGSGKTTALKLLMALYGTDGGFAAVTDKNGVTCPVSAATRSLFAYVPQGGMLFSGTVRDNLTLARSASEEEIGAALRTACADFVFSLPKGLDTELTELGGGVSEGQAQRISLARALLSGAPVLLLDEATSALDAETERLLLTNLKSIEDKTVIMVSHRRAPTAACERVINISGGRADSSRKDVQNEE